jgi:hypothetical protein
VLVGDVYNRDIGVAAGGVAFLQFRHAATVERVGIGPIEPDRLGVVGDGAVEVALVVPGDAAVYVGGGVFRIEPGRCVCSDVGLTSSRTENLPKFQRYIRLVVSL